MVKEWRVRWDKSVEGKLGEVVGVDFGIKE